MPEPELEGRDVQRVGQPALTPEQGKRLLEVVADDRYVAPRVVMETLGHSQISLTMNTYAHVAPALVRAAADRMDEVLAMTHPNGHAARVT